MALPLIPLILFGTGVGLIGTGIGIQGAQGSKNEDAVDKARYNYEKVAKEHGLENVDDSEIARELYHTGKISEEEYRSVTKTIEKYEKADTPWKQFWMTLDNDERDALTKYYDTVSREIPELKETIFRTIDTNMSTEDKRALFGVPTLEALQGPSYLDTSFKGYQKYVEPVKLWTGQELAELHNLDYNPDNYYDLVKAGTSAAVDQARYTSEQLNNASLVDDTENVASYLDSIRNTKAEALANGATLGQRAANELLANQEALGAYATNQAAVADSRLAAVDSALLADAQARLTASDYFTQLAKSLAADSMTLYANDTTRYSQDMLSNAEMYKADQELRGRRTLANANMWSTYTQGQAQLDAYQSQLDSRMNEYFWLYNTALKANNGDAGRAAADVNNLIQYQYTGYKTPQEQYANK